MVRYLQISRATYGHPKGTSSTGRMSYDVTEIIQGYVDMHGGNYLNISALTPLQVNHNIKSLLSSILLS
jgi:hypothetical protein